MGSLKLIRIFKETLALKCLDKFLKNLYCFKQGINMEDKVG